MLRETVTSCGDRIRTCDLEVMSLASYRAAPPRDMYELKIAELGENRQRAAIDLQLSLPHPSVGVEGCCSRFYATYPPRQLALICAGGFLLLHYTIPTAHSADQQSIKTGADRFS